MTVRRGEPWGAPGPLAPGAPVVGSDAAAADAVSAQRAAGVEVPEVGLVGGDLHRTVGAPSRSEAALRAGEGVRLPVDLIEVSLVLADGRAEVRTGIAHLVGRRRALFAGRTVAVLSAGFVGSSDLGVRAHPGDGLLDVMEADLPRRDRQRARRRALTGTHVPHPRIVEQRTKEAELASPDALSWYLDGRALPPVRALRVRVLPDAAVVVV